MKSKYLEVVRVDEIPVGGCHALKTGNCPIVVFRPEEGEIYAVENRCPHEGYPLSTGRVADGKLTCEWHNWKFNLADGECVIGGEDVRSFPVEVRDGTVWLDVTEPESDAIVAAEQKSLVKAFDEGDFSHAARAVERLLAAGESTSDVLAFGVEWGARHCRWGFDHGLATAADLGAAIERRPYDADYFIVDAFELIVQPNLRLPEIAAPDPRDRGDEAAYRAAVEREDMEAARSMIAAECAAPDGVARAFRWIRHAATDHFFDYGHGHIYAVKGEELVERVGEAHAPAVLVSLAEGLVYGTREDQLPYMRSYQKHVAKYEARLDDLFERAQDAPFDVERVVEATTNGTLEEALDAVGAALEQGAEPAKIALALSLAASRRLLAFDLRLEGDPEAQEGWLDVTHALTHADAVYESLRRHKTPELLRGLFQSARFIQHLAVLDAPPSPGPQRTLDEAIRLQEPQAAVAAVLREPATAGDILMDRAADGLAVLPIFFAHRVKTAFAAVRLSDALTEAFPERDDAHWPLAAAARFLASKLSERRVRRRVFTARTFVREGKMPRRRLGY
ncbi:MAG: Rieske 2Fe-2S domain-containing protein [Deltaproteobacteria bacterium]